MGFDEFLTAEFFRGGGGSSIYTMSESHFSDGKNKKWQKAHHAAPQCSPSPYSSRRPTPPTQLTHHPRDRARAPHERAFSNIPCPTSCALLFFSLGGVTSFPSTCEQTAKIHARVWISSMTGHNGGCSSGKIPGAAGVSAMASKARASHA